MATHCCLATGDAPALQSIVLAFEDESKELSHQREGRHMMEEGGEVQGGEEHGLGALLW